MTQGGRALLVVIASAAVGVAYFAYLNAVDFPPTVARLVPLLWLATAVGGWILGARGMREAAGKAAAIASLVLNVPNTVFAALFAIGALLGD